MKYVVRGWVQRFSRISSSRGARVFLGTFFIKNCDEEHSLKGEEEEEEEEEEEDEMRVGDCPVDEEDEEGKEKLELICLCFKSSFLSIFSSHFESVEILLLLLLLSLLLLLLLLLSLLVLLLLLLLLLLFYTFANEVSNSLETKS